MRNILILVFVIIGDLIGAGFASGQEIYSFFFLYGNKGIIGILIMCILITMIIYKSLKIIYNNKIKTYSEFLNQFVKNKKVIKIVDIILNILLIITFYIMIAGFGAYFEQEIGTRKIVGSLVIVFMCYLIFLTNVKGVLKVSEYIVPILITCIMIIGIKAISTINIQNIELITIKKRWFLSSLIYCSYNTILLIPVLISLGNQIQKEKNIKHISIITGVIICILSLIIFAILAKANTNISELEMPVVYIVRTQFSELSKIYTFIILASIFTTAISIGIGVLQNISKNKKSYTQFVTILCITSLLVSNFGFSKLINFAYPLFGYIGIIQIVLILSKNICKKRCL